VQIRCELALDRWKRSREQGWCVRAIPSSYGCGQCRLPAAWAAGTPPVFAGAKKIGLTAASARQENPPNAEPARETTTGNVHSVFDCSLRANSLQVNRQGANDFEGTGCGRANRRRMGSPGVRGCRHHRLLRHLWHEPVTCASDRDDVAWVGGVFLDVAAKSRDEVVHRAGSRHAVVLPDRTE